jgi:hypothetical protein
VGRRAGANPAAPDDLRLGLLGRSRHLLWREQSPSVVETAIAHPEWHHEDQPLPRSVFEAEDLGDKALKTCRLTPGLAEHLAHHGTETQRSRALLHARLGRGAPRRP